MGEPGTPPRARPGSGPGPWIRQVRGTSQPTAPGMERPRLQVRAGCDLREASRTARGLPSRLVLLTAEPSETPGRGLNGAGATHPLTAEWAPRTRVPPKSSPGPDAYMRRHQPD